MAGGFGAVVGDQHLQRFALVDASDEIRGKSVAGLIDPEFDLLVTAALLGVFGERGIEHLGERVPGGVGQVIAHEEQVPGLALHQLRAGIGVPLPLHLDGLEQRVGAEPALVVAVEAAVRIGQALGRMQGCGHARGLRPAIQRTQGAVIELHAGTVCGQSEQLESEGAAHGPALGSEASLEYRAPVADLQARHGPRGVPALADQRALKAIALVDQQHLPGGAGHRAAPARGCEREFCGQQPRGGRQVRPTLRRRQRQAHGRLRLGLELRRAEQPCIGAIGEQTRGCLAGPESCLIKTHCIGRRAGRATFHRDIRVEPLVDVATRTADLNAVVDHRGPGGDEVHHDGFLARAGNRVPHVLGFHIGAVKGHVGAIKRGAGHADVVVRDAVGAGPAAGADGRPVGGCGGGQRHHGVRRQHARIDQSGHRRELALAAVLEQRGSHRAVEAEDQDFAGFARHRVISVKAVLAILSAMIRAPRDTPKACRRENKR